MTNEELNEEVQKIARKMNELGILRITYDSTVEGADIEAWYRIGRRTREMVNLPFIPEGE